MASARALSTAASAESEAFRKCSSDLLRGIQDPELLAWELYSDDVVSDTVVDEVGVLGLSAVQRKARLLSAVRNQIAVDPSKFHNLVRALKKQPPLVNVAEKLETIFKNCAVSQPQESAHTYNLGFPVELLREPWYHTGITRGTAEERLEHATNGCFLVRESETKPGCFSLSLKHPEDIAHFPIERKDSGHYEVPGTHKGFTTLPDLIDYFTRHSISENPHHLLSSPCLKAPPNGKTPRKSNSSPPPPIPETEKHQQQRVPIPVPRKLRLASGKHISTSPKTRAPPNDDQRSGSNILPHAQDNKSLLLHPHSKLRWRRGADLPVAMCSHQMVRIGNKVYCGGGYTGYVNTSRRVFRYDPEQDKWSPLPICPTRLFGLTQLDGKLVTVGGKGLGNFPVSDVYVFEDSQTWEKSIPSLPTARFYPTAFVYNSVLVVSGGITHWVDAVKSTRTAAVEVFQSKSSQWYCAQPLPFAHNSMSPAIINDTCYLIGGSSTGHDSLNQGYYISIPSLIETAVPAEETSTTCQAFPSPPTWQVLPRCPFSHACTAELGGCLLAIGGTDDSNVSSSAVHVYSPSTSSWVRISSGDLPVPRWDAAATQLDTGEVIFVGGEVSERKPTTTIFVASIEQ